MSTKLKKILHKQGNLRVEDLRVVLCRVIKKNDDHSDFELTEKQIQDQTRQLCANI